MVFQKSSPPQKKKLFGIFLLRLSLREILQICWQFIFIIIIIYLFSKMEKYS